nr:BEN domain-containing protein 5-like [Rhipicephalus microplus]
MLRSTVLIYCCRTRGKDKHCWWRKEHYTSRPKWRFHLYGRWLFPFDERRNNKWCVCKKIFGNKKATLVVKDAAHAIWGSNVLASRSVTGTVGSRKRALGEQPKQPLTPEKLLVVSETLKHWGQQKDVNTADTEKNLPRILAEKIQDLLKSKVRKQMFDDQAQ